MTLLIVSDMPHFEYSGQFFGWGPTVEEIDELAKLFSEIRHICFLYPGNPPASALPYASPKVKVIGLPPSGGIHLTDKIGILKKAPVYLNIMLAELTKADVIHVRCPANISLLAIIMLAFISKPKYRWVKYAGNWQPKNATPWSYNFQRWWLRRGYHRGIVSINGKWTDQHEHVYSLFNPSLTSSDIQQGKLFANEKNLVSPIQLLFVGALNTSKGIDRALKITYELYKRQSPFEFNILGDGTDRERYQVWVKESQLDHCIHFHGWLPKSKLSEYYKRAHILLHPTESDGWPKVISEGMAYGVVPLAGAVSSIPQMLKEIGTGAALPPHDIDHFVNAILQYINEPSLWQRESQAGLKSAPNFSYVHYLHSVRDMFADAWDLNLESLNN